MRFGLDIRDIAQFAVVFVRFRFSWNTHDVDKRAFDLKDLEEKTEVVQQSQGCDNRTFVCLKILAYSLCITRVSEISAGQTRAVFTYMKFVRSRVKRSSHPVETRSTSTDA